MRLALTFPQPWQVLEAPRNQLVAILPRNGQRDAIVTFGPILLAPDEPNRWMQQTAASDLPPDSKIRAGEKYQHETDAGWKMWLVEAEVIGANEELIECRLCAFFTFMEHAASAIARTGSRERFATHKPALARIFSTGRPDWRQLVCMDALWDLQPVFRAKKFRVSRTQHGTDQRQVLKAELPDAEAKLAAQPNARNAVNRGNILLGLQQPEQALAAFQDALQLDNKAEAAHYFAGVALGALGRHREAIECWQQALALDPDRADTIYNLAQAYFREKDFERALCRFEQVVALEPDDFMTKRKVVQCLYALGRYDEGTIARKRFREHWASTTDARARFVHEYVFDQYAGDGFQIHALETLCPKNPAMYTIFTFRATDADDQPLAAEVVIETSDRAKKAGTPYVLGITTDNRFRVVELLEHLPAYRELKDRAAQILSNALNKGR